MFVSIKKASEILGVSQSTLRKWEATGKLVPEHKTEFGHRRYNVEKLQCFKKIDYKNKIAIGYCRVSSFDQKDDLGRQIETVANYCSANGYQFRIIEDMGSGLNYNKKGLKELIQLINNREISRIVINYKDRLLRFGFEIIENLCYLNNIKIEIINQTENKPYQEELVDDVLSIITVFSAKLYGSRSHKINKIKEVNKQLFEKE